MPKKRIRKSPPGSRASVSLSLEEDEPPWKSVLRGAEILRTELGLDQWLQGGGNNDVQQPEEEQQQHPPSEINIVKDENVPNSSHHRYNDMVKRGSRRPWTAEMDNSATSQERRTYSNLSKSSSHPPPFQDEDEEPVARRPSGSARLAMHRQNRQQRGRKSMEADFDTTTTATTATSSFRASPPLRATSSSRAPSLVARASPQRSASERPAVSAEAALRSLNRAELKLATAYKKALRDQSPSPIASVVAETAPPAPLRKTVSMESSRSRPVSRCVSPTEERMMKPPVRQSSARPPRPAGPSRAPPSHLRPLADAILELNEEDDDADTDFSDPWAGTEAMIRGSKPSVLQQLQYQPRMREESYNDCGHETDESSLFDHLIDDTLLPGQQDPRWAREQLDEDDDDIAPEATLDIAAQVALERQAVAQSYRSRRAAPARSLSMSTPQEMVTLASWKQQAQREYLGIDKPQRQPSNLQQQLDQQEFLIRQVVSMENDQPPVPVSRTISSKSSWSAAKRQADVLKALQSYNSLADQADDAYDDYENYEALRRVASAESQRSYLPKQLTTTELPPESSPTSYQGRSPKHYNSSPLTPLVSTPPKPMIRKQNSIPNLLASDSPFNNDELSPEPYPIPSLMTSETSSSEDISLPSIHSSPLQRHQKDDDSSCMPCPLTVQYQLLLNDPAYMHAVRAGTLWQSLVGSQIRFPYAWFNGQRGPPLGGERSRTAEQPTWQYYGCHSVVNDTRLMQFVPHRASPGRLLLHVCCQDLVDPNSNLHIAVGCLDPSARGIRKSELPKPAIRTHRWVWWAVRKAPGGVSVMDAILASSNKENDKTYPCKYPLGPKRRVNNLNVRAVFGEQPPVRTLIMRESNLCERLMQNTSSFDCIAMKLLAEFVF